MARGTPRFVGLGPGGCGRGRQDDRRHPHSGPISPTFTVHELAERCDEVREALERAETPIRLVGGAEVSLSSALDRSDDELRAALPSPCAPWLAHVIASDVHRATWWRPVTELWNGVVAAADLAGVARAQWMAELAPAATLDGGSFLSRRRPTGRHAGQLLFRSPGTKSRAGGVEPAGPGRTRSNNSSPVGMVPCGG
jgi:hypothetical protein